MTDTTVDEVEYKFDPIADNKAREAIIGARVTLLLRHAFFGNLATRLVLVNADQWCNTAAVDGRHFYYNTKWINSLTPAQMTFLFAHEVGHIVYDHMARRGDRDAKIYNCACDYAINLDITEAGIGEMPQPGLYDTKYNGMSSEQIYDELMKDVKTIDINALVEKMLSEHLDPNNSGEGNGPVQMSAEERRQLADEIKEAILNAAKAAGMEKVPAGMRKLIKNFTEPKLDWRELIQQRMISTVKSDYTFMRPSRRGWHLDCILPGTDVMPAIDVFVAIDTSGSISDDALKDFLNEIKGIMQMFQNAFKIHAFSFDTSVHSPKVFTEANSDDLTDYVPEGGGGTDFLCAWDYVHNNSDTISDQLTIFFTDGYPCGNWAYNANENVLWIIYGNETVVPPFGQYAYYNKRGA